MLPETPNLNARLEAGRRLTALGWVPEDLNDFVFISASDQFGSITRDFYISKYPVTVLQYQSFLAADDFADEILWQSIEIHIDKEAKVLVGARACEWLSRARVNQRKPKYWPEDATDILNPAILSWFEAAAYCNWLNRHWKEVDIKLPDIPYFRLVKESEWVIAAGGVTNTRYPWQKGETIDEGNIIHYAHSLESGFGSLTPVFMYKAGMSPLGVMDMIGNAREWTANYYDINQDVIALRGGSWGDTYHHLTIASRLGLPPDTENGGAIRIVAQIE